MTLLRCLVLKRQQQFLFDRFLFLKVFFQYRMLFIDQKSAIDIFCLCINPLFTMKHPHHNVIFAFIDQHLFLYDLKTMLMQKLPDFVQIGLRLQDTFADTLKYLKPRFQDTDCQQSAHSCNNHCISLSRFQHS